MEIQKNHMKNRVAIVTGTTRGIGKAILQAFLKENILSVSIDRNTRENEHPDLHTSILFDLKHIEQLDSLVTEILRRVDLDNPEHIYLVNNAAVIGEIGPMNSVAGKNLREVIDINLTSPVLLSSHLIRALAPYAIPLTLAHISSGAAFHPIQGLGAYCISKAGLEMASKILAREHGTKGIRSVTIGPGVVDTAMQDQLRSASPESFGALQQFRTFKEKGMLQSPEKVGQTIVSFLLEGRFENGKYYETGDL
jgi:benzil reductase ((S)-benzoin forming)